MPARNALGLSSPGRMHVRSISGSTSAQSPSPASEGRGAAVAESSPRLREPVSSPSLSPCRPTAAHAKNGDYPYRGRASSDVLTATVHSSWSTAILRTS